MDRERERQREGETETQREGETETQRGRDRDTDHRAACCSVSAAWTERGRDRHTERERQRHREGETETQREGEAETLTTGQLVAQFLQLGHKEAVQVVGVGVKAPSQLHRRREPVLLKAAKQTNKSFIHLEISTAPYLWLKALHK